MSDTALKKFFEFDDNDLAANEMGRLSTKQDQRFKELEKNTSKTFRWIGIGLIVLGIWIIYTILNSSIDAGFSFSNASRNDIWEFAMGLTCPSAILGFFAWVMFWIASSKADYSLQSVEGEINFVKVEKQESYKSASGSTSYRTVQKYELRVGKVKFNDVDEELLNLIKEGDTYLFYYTKDSKQILSCRLISKGK